MALYGCALDMMLLWVSTIIHLELIAVSLSLGAPGAPKTTICPLNMQISFIVASIFLSMLFLVYFCFALHMMDLCVSSNIALKLMALPLVLGGPWGP